MNYNNLPHHPVTQEQTTPCSSSRTAAGALNSSAGANDLFSTLRHLAAGNNPDSRPNASVYYNQSSTSFNSIPTANLVSSNNWAANVGAISSSSWLDQAKLSLLPMYGMLHSSINSSNELCRNQNLWMDSNIQQAAAAAINAMQNFPPFGHLAPSAGLSHFHSNDSPQLNSTFGSPSNDGMANNATIQSPQVVASGGHQRQASRSYSQSTASTSHTPQSNGPPSQTATVSPPEGQSAIKMAEFSNRRPDQTIVPHSIEEFSEFDLHDFEDLLMDKPTTSFQPSVQSHSTPFPISKELDKANSIEANRSGDVDDQPMHFRADELASADMELDRLVSLVASQNGAGTILPQHRPSESVTTTTSVFEPTYSKAFLSSSDQNNFGVPQFTPPDSPSNSIQQPPEENKNFDRFPASAFSKSYTSSESTTSTFIRKSNNATKIQRQQRVAEKDEFMLIPNDKKVIKKEPESSPLKLQNLAFARRNTSSKVPIYKQSMQVFKPSDDINTQSVTSQRNKLTDDAFSFEEEDEQSSNDGSLMSMLHRNKQPEAKDRRGSSEDEQTRVKRKYTRHSIPATSSHVKSVERSNKAGFMLADRIRNRRTHTFISSEVASDDHAVITDTPIPVCTIRSEETSGAISANPSTNLSLPKLVIKLPKIETHSEEYGQTMGSKNKKKKKKKDRDIDWTQTDEYHGGKTREKKRKKEHKRRKYSTDENCLAAECNNTAASSFLVMDQNNLRNSEDVHEVSDNPFCTAKMSARLRLFERPTERPRRGTFLLPKEDLFKPDCALWRIDNQNLLQKYLPILIDGTICYQNSSTYSGWCEHYVDDYIAIRVDYIKQSRSENIVRPIVPLEDLFPAINHFVKEKDKIAHKNNEKAEIEEPNWNSKEQQFRTHLFMFIKMMLKHAVTLQFVQEIRQNNDWNYLCILTEMEATVRQALGKINSQELWSNQFTDSLHNYPRISVIRELVMKIEHSCQACRSNSQDAKCVLQLFGHDEEENYDYETLLPLHSNSSFIPMDFYVCQRCETQAMLYHEIYHLRFTIFKICESKLETMSCECPDLSTDELILKCMDDKSWINKMVSDILCTLHIIANENSGMPGGTNVYKYES